MSNSLSYEPLDAYYTVSDQESDDFENRCPANVGPNDLTYRPCLKKMRKYRSGKTVCPTHGHMH